MAPTLSKPKKLMSKPYLYPLQGGTWISLDHVLSIRTKRKWSDPHGEKKSVQDRIIIMHGDPANPEPLVNNFDTFEEAEFAANELAHALNDHRINSQTK